MPTASLPAPTQPPQVLTAYDLTSRRVVMPVPEVEAGLPSAATVDLLTLAAVDEGQCWAFPTLRAWTNVAGRRGYLLDGFADWLVARGAAEGDSLAFYRDSDASPPVGSLVLGEVGGARAAALPVVGTRVMCSGASR